MAILQLEKNQDYETQDCRVTRKPPAELDPEFSIVAPVWAFSEGQCVMFLNHMGGCSSRAPGRREAKMKKAPGEDL